MNASQFVRLWRVLIGPPRAMVTVGLFEIGAPVTLPTATTTTTDVDPTTVTVNVASTTGWPTIGTFTIVSSAGTGWASYTSLTGTTFTGVRWLSGIFTHASGATVTQWNDISDRITRPPTISENEDLPIYDWEASLEGVNFDGHLFRNDATVCIQQKLTPDGSYGTYTGWLVAAVGYVREWQSTGDSNQVRPWQATVESVSAYIKRHPVPARNYGRHNLAKDASITASPALGDSTLELVEYGGGVGTTEASNVADENPDTRYVSSIAPGSAAETPASSGSASELLIEEVLVEGPVGAPSSLQYIVLKLASYSEYYNEEGLNIKDHVLTTTNTVFTESSVEDWAPDVYDNYIRCPNITLTPENPRVILCQNRAVYERFFGTGGLAQVFEWRELGALTIGSVRRPPTDLPADDLTLDPDGDVVQLRNQRANVEPAILDMVAWGSPSLFYQDNDDTSQWNEPTTVALGAGGSSIRRKPSQTDTNTAADWAIEERPIPGDARTDTDDVYISVDCGQFNITPDGTQTITSTFPGVNEWLNLTDATPLDESGTIQIDTEQITYGERTDTSLKIAARGANGTTPASHANSALVYHVDDDLGANRLYSVDMVELRRQSVLDSNGLPIVPSRVELWASQEASPAYPGTGGYRSDWLAAGALWTHANDNNSLKIIMPLMAPHIDIVAPRVRHVMVRIRAMSDGGRAKLNDLYVWRKQSLSSVTPSGQFGAGIVVYDLLRKVLADSEISIDPQVFVGTSSDRQISAGNIQDILTDLLNETMTTLRYGLDGIVTITRAPTHPLGPRPGRMATLDAAATRSGQEVTRPSRYIYDQLTVEIDDPRTEEFYIAKYPPRQIASGESKRIQLRLEVGNENVAAWVAQALYLDDPETSRTFRGTTSGPAEWMHAGDRVFVYDGADVSAEAADLINCRIVSVEHGGDDGVEVFEAKEWRMP
jgi:hypothetical protein